MGRLDKRIEALQKIYNASSGHRGGNLEEQEERRAAFIDLIRAAEERAGQEETERHPTRRRALDELKEHIRKRAGLE